MRHAPPRGANRNLGPAGGRCRARAKRARAAGAAAATSAEAMDSGGGGGHAGAARRGRAPRLGQPVQRLFKQVVEGERAACRHRPPFARITGIRWLRV